MCMIAQEKVIPVRCQPKTSPCPSCGTSGRRVPSPGYQAVVWLRVFYAEYPSRCSCCKYFRSWPLDVPPKADYDDRVRQAVLDRLLDDGLNVERTRRAMQRDFLLNLSSGFVYDCLDERLRRLNLPEHRRRTLVSFSGILCIDELHLGPFTLLLATDPLTDAMIGFALVKVHYQAHMRRFLLLLKY